VFSWIVHRFEIGILAELKLASVAELGKTTPQTAPNWASICAYYVSSVDFRLGQSWSDSVRPDKARQISCVKNLVWAVLLEHFRDHFLLEPLMMHMTFAAAFATAIFGVHFQGASAWPSRAEISLAVAYSHELHHLYRSLRIFIQ